MKGEGEGRLKEGDVRKRKGKDREGRLKERDVRQRKGKRREG